MTARVYLHPRTVEFIGLYQMVQRMKDRGYEVDTALSPKYFIAVPDAPPPASSPPSCASSPVVPIERRARPFDFWWPRT